MTIFGPTHSDITYTFVPSTETEILEWETIYAAIKKIKIDSPTSALAEIMPALFTSVACPAECGLTYHQTHICSLIIHLNDQCKWSREQIADWLETLDVDLSFPIDGQVS